jgi:hypothetical protein
MFDSIRVFNCVLQQSHSERRAKAEAEPREKPAVDARLQTSAGLTFATAGSSKVTDENDSDEILTDHRLR